mmetsp:Transcript_5365/g.12254  ORF Transcript_5365/g.12254 Transcript_5365/m.12254 type:complete len:117 (-) Transcript_5365:823-1173(-)
MAKRKKAAGFLGAGVAVAVAVAFDTNRKLGSASGRVLAKNKKNERKDDGLLFFFDCFALAIRPPFQSNNGRIAPGSRPSTILDNKRIIRRDAFFDGTENTRIQQHDNIVITAIIVL